ncbi:MAG: twin-arginine translocation signal domain-containing protein, partial [Desulfitobacteriaceae bacterium]|nr:twin-arginine translocation signal domain-containing protein [Desulfitobacteriaceae bacterium]
MRGVKGPLLVGVARGYENQSERSCCVVSREFFWQMDRRGFLKLCGGVAAALGLSEVSVPKIAEVLAASAAKPPVIWLELGSCT